MKKALFSLMLTGVVFLAAMPPDALALSVYLPVNAGRPSAEGVRDADYFLLSEASEHIRKSEYVEALEKLKLAEEKNPVNLLTLYQLGCLHLEMAKRSNNEEQAAHLNAAGDALERVLGLNSNLALTYFKLGKIALMKNDMEAAKRYYRDGLAVEPNNAALFFNLGRVYDQNNEKAQAIVYYRKALALDPKFVYAYNNLALLLEEEGHYREAERAYRRALRLDPNYGLVYLNLANLYAATGRYDRAERLYGQILHREPRNAWAYYYRGNLFMRRGRYADAITAYRQSLELNPNQATAYYLMAVACSRLNRMDEALQAGLNYVRIAPDGEYVSEMKKLILSVKLSQSHGLGLFYMQRAKNPNSPSGL